MPQGPGIWHLLNAIPPILLLRPLPMHAGTCTPLTPSLSILAMKPKLLGNPCPLETGHIWAPALPGGMGPGTAAEGSACAPGSV